MWFNIIFIKSLYLFIKMIMRQEMMNEINQMKYLFGYKAGMVISEQTKPVDVNNRMVTLIGEILKNASEGKMYFSSGLYPKSIVINMGKSSSDGDDSYVDVEFRIMGIAGLVVSDSYMTTRLSPNNLTGRIGNLDWNQLYDLWNSKKLKVSEESDGKLLIRNIFPSSTARITAPYILAVGENPDDKKRMEVLNYFESVVPGSKRMVLNDLRESTPEEYNIVLKLLNPQKPQ